MALFGMMTRSALLVTAIAALVATTTLPATAQLVRRHNDGSVSIDPLLCQTDYEVRQAIARAGFKNILLNAPIETHIRARGTKGNTVYVIDYNRCFGGIVSAVPQRRAR